MLATVASGCILAALQWEQFLFHTIIKIHLTAQIFMNAKSAKIIDAQVKPPNTTDDYLISESRLDVRDYNELNLRKHADKKAKGGKKGGKKKTGAEAKKKNADEEKAEKKKEEEEERLKNWEKEWDKKLAAQEALDDRTCCMQQGFCLRPKTQSDLYIKVTQDKTMQDIQMAFVHVPVPKPKCPPLPPLPVKPPETPPKKGKGKGKAKGKGKGKKK